MSEIPVLSVDAPDFAEAMLDACRRIGFFAVVDHGIAVEQFEAMRTLCAEVFAQPEAAKRSARITRDNYRGYIPLGFFTPNRIEANGATPDLYEGFKLHWECAEGRSDCALYGPNRWVEQLPQMKPTVLEYWDACDRLAGMLLDTLAPSLGLTTAELRSLHADPLTNMTLLHYPERPADGSVGIHPHKDTNVLTFLHPDPVGGLQVRASDGSWIEPDVPEHALLVNTGEMLELWSGGRMPATPHRVLNPSGAERYSFPWFLVPNHAVTVRALLPPIDGFARAPMPVGELSAEVWRTNWPDEQPTAAGHDLGTLDR